ncbi:MAG TPA: DUF6132 family protein [bacterium]
MRMVAGALLGALAGSLWSRLIGCATGACPITSKPFISMLYGALLGLLLAAAG